LSSFRYFYLFVMSHEIVPAENNQIAIRRPEAKHELARLGKGTETALSPYVQNQLARTKQAVQGAQAARLETLRRKPLSVYLAVDYSGSTTALDATLREESSAITRAVIAQSPTATINFGVFGGNNFIETKQSSRILTSGHQPTNGWASTLNQYLERLVPDLHTEGTSNLVIVFTDAIPGTENLAATIEKINKTDTAVVIAYVPSEGSSINDRDTLVKVADLFKRGVFLDLEKVTVGDSSVLNPLIEELVNAADTANQNQPQGNPGAAAISAHTAFKKLAGEVVTRALRISSTKNPKGLLI